MRSCAPSSIWLCSPAGGKVGIGLLVLEQHAVAVHQNVGDESAALASEMRSLLHGRRIRPRGDRQVERVSAASTYLAMLTCEMSSASLFLSKPWAEPSAGNSPCSGDAGHVEQIAHRVLVFGARQPAHAGSAFVRPAGACSVSASAWCNDFKALAASAASGAGVLFPAASRRLRCGRGS